MQLPLKYRERAADDWHDGETENVSRSGVLFRIDRALPLDTQIEVRLALPADDRDPGAMVVCRARVVRTEGGSDSDPRPAVAAAIKAYRLTHDEDSGPDRMGR